MFEINFSGDYDNTLDEKNRVVLPARFRDHLAAGVYVTKGEDHCAAVFPREAFVAKAEAMMATASRGDKRVFLAGSIQQVPDRQGRVIVPEKVRVYAGLRKDVSVIGLGDHLEIWDRDAWTTYLQEHDERFANREER